SMLAALALPSVLDHAADRGVMLAAATGLTGLTLALGAWVTAAGLPDWGMLLAAWAATGFAYAAVLTPAGRLLRRSSHAGDRPALFAAQFALSHACWLVTYPVAGWAGTAVGMGATLLILGGLAAVGLLLALRLWPAGDPEVIAHAHPDLPPDHPHLQQHGGAPHRHAFVIDDEHRSWPTQG
ncbi:MFS transporter, partial [Rhodobacterales bacterium HKCCSP123]|nr:MFS transporter [Rhodobacterales bacterium HKCCSP123]